MSLSTAFVILLVATLYYMLYSNNSQFSEHKVILSDIIDDEYDYVIVGGGTAGSVLAARLSEDKGNKVLLLEAGGFYDDTHKFHTLMYWGELQHSKYDWGFYTEPQRYSCFGLKDNRSYWPRGKVLGGSGMINLAQYTRGSRYDFDAWAAKGCKGWSYKEVLPYFLKAEDIQIEELKASKYHNDRGPMAVSGGGVTQLAESYLKAGQELGYEILDYNGKDQAGFNQIQINTRKGLRDSSAVAYLGRTGRKDNLHIVINTHVTKLGLSGTTANGVYYIRNNKKFFVTARKEVVLSAGVINTPQILMLSGIGPKDHLDDMEIPVVADLPVGNNLQDHQSIFIPSKINKPISLTPSLMSSMWTKVQYYMLGSGPLAISGVDGSAFLHFDETKRGKTYPDLQIAFLSSPASKFDIANFKDDIQTEFENASENDEGFASILVNVHPKSRGTLRLRSTDPFEYPRLDPRYLADPEDMSDFIAAIRIWERFIETPTMKELGADINHMKKSFCSQHKFRSDAYWECIVRHLAVSSYHISCTCRMGDIDDNTAVLDPFLRVKGIKGLRVVDASAFPNITVGNLNAPTVMLAEKAADMIRGIDSVKDIRNNLPDDI